MYHTLLVLIFSYRIPWWWAICAGHVILAASIVLIARFSLLPSPSPRLPFSPSPFLPLSPPRPPSFIRGWYPVLLIPITYKELSYLIPLIHPRDFDETLAGIDYRFLGVHPTVWIERFTWPPLTEVFQLTYSSYYFLPMILGVVLWRKGWFEKFYFWVLSGVWVLLVVSGIHRGSRYRPAVSALNLRRSDDTANRRMVVSAGARDAGPRRRHHPRLFSERSHGANAACALLCAHVSSQVFWLLLPLGTGVIVSTVYLRYHYVIDVVAGAFLAVAVVMVAKPFFRVLGGNEALESE